jgi:hypothetical protein
MPAPPFCCFGLRLRSAWEFQPAFSVRRPASKTSGIVGSIANGRIRSRFSHLRANRQAPCANGRNRCVDLKIEPRWTTQLWVCLFYSERELTLSSES